MMAPARDGSANGRTTLTARLGILVGLVALLWLLEVADLLVFGGALDANGIRPRSEVGLRGILFAPLLHAGFGHLLANSVPLLVLGWLVIVRGLRDFLWATAVVTILGGLGVWLFGQASTVHLGASGLIFGYLGYLFLRGFWERSVVAAMVALIAGVLYGSALWGVLPGRANVSWEGHLFGFAGGAGAATVHRRPRAEALPAS